MKYPIESTKYKTRYKIQYTNTRQS